MNTEQLQQSRLVKLKSGQTVGYPVTRRELKQQLRQSRLERRAAFRAEKRAANSDSRKQQL